MGQLSIPDGATLYLDTAPIIYSTLDAIHAATALNIGCTGFLTNDAGLRTIPGLSVVVLKDVLNS